MSLHWTLIAGFLYGEIFVLLLLTIPFISNKAWNKLFKSRFLKGLENQLIYYFYVLVAILVLFFLDAIREMRKYSDEQSAVDASQHGSHLDAQMQMQMRLFRAQRNFYISGFTLFLCLVIKRMVALISSNASLDAEKSAAISQAASASRAAETLMDTAGGSVEKSGSDKKVKALEDELKQARDELKKAKLDVESMKSQSKSLTDEYDRLADEHSKLEKKLRISGGGVDSGDKKDD